MSYKTLAIVCALFIAPLGGGGIRSLVQPEADGLSGMPKPAPGEDPEFVRRNFLWNLFAEHSGGRVTTVKFGEGRETKCPMLSSLFFSGGRRLEWLTPNFSLEDLTMYVEGTDPEGTSADLVVGNAACRYVLTVRRFEREDGEEKAVRVKDLPKVEKNLKYFKPPPAKDQDDKGGFREERIPFVDSSKPLDFTGMAFFAPMTLTVYLANAANDLEIASESNFLTHTYKVEIKNAQAALRISINKEFYSNGQWVNAYDK